MIGGRHGGVAVRCLRSVTARTAATVLAMVVGLVSATIAAPLSAPLTAQGAGAADRHQAEGWVGYIGAVRVADRWSIWHDYHWVPEVFAVARYGATWKPATGLHVTGGHAWVWTSTSATTALARREVRPWGQVLLQQPLRDGVTGQLRLRYDARFRQRVEEGVVQDDFGFNHRVRFMGRLRTRLAGTPDGGQLHLDLMDEVLVNAGSEVRNGLDQHRVFLLLGRTSGSQSLLGGYHLRMVPAAAGGTTFRHGLTVWLVHTLDVRDRLRRAPERDPVLPVPG